MVRLLATFPTRPFGYPAGLQPSHGAPFDTLATTTSTLPSPRPLTVALALPAIVSRPLAHSMSKALACNSFSPENDSLVTGCATNLSVLAVSKSNQEWHFRRNEHIDRLATEVVREIDNCFWATEIGEQDTVSVLAPPSSFAISTSWGASARLTE